MRLDHFFLCTYLRARIVRLRPSGLRWTSGTKELPFAGYSIAEALTLFDIVWDDSGFARFASYVETGKHACRAVAPSGAEAETPGSTNREWGNW